MDFSEALKWLKDGMKVTRNGWQPGRYVTLVLRFDREAPEFAAAMGEPDGLALVYEPRLMLHSRDGEPVEWRPSGSDLFAQDWLCASEDGVIAWPDDTITYTIMRPGGTVA